MLYERGERTTYEAVVSLTDASVVVLGRDPGCAGADHGRGVHRLRGDRAGRPALAGGACASAASTDFSLTMIDPWASSWTGPDDDAADRRIARPLTWLRSAPGENGYARPVEGLIVRGRPRCARGRRGHRPRRRPVAARAGQLRGAVALRRRTTCRRSTRYRDDVKPIEITQPDGPSFTVDGHAVAGRSGTLRIGFTPREGLVLHQVSYARPPIVHRASLAEMYVPYGDPAPTHRFKNVFDQGEYGVGWLANSLSWAATASGTSTTSTASSTTTTAAPSRSRTPSACTRRTRASRGSTWTSAPRRSQVRRRRRLVISSIATVGNYEYGYFWYLYTDGTIEYEVKLTGVISTGAIAQGETPRHGTLVAPGLYGPHHQHFFCVRLDMAVDGAENTRRRDRLGAQRARAGQPARQRVGDPPHRAGERVGGAPRHRTRRGALLEDRERRAEVSRWAHRRPTR